jgi:mediator of RNA polymerase II transcription subunit 12, fungi type
VYAVDGLAYTKSRSSDTDEAIKEESMVVNRPWEWTENLGDPSAGGPENDDGFEVRHLIKNTGSLALETFGTRMTGDVVFDLPDPEGGETDFEHPQTIEQIIRTFSDGSHSESVFARDYRETRVVDIENMISDQMAQEGVGNNVRANSVAMSPHGSILTRSSTHSSPIAGPSGSVSSSGGMGTRSSISGSRSKSGRPSPAGSTYNRHSSSTIPEIIDVDDDSAMITSRVSKRKAADSDDDAATKRTKTAATNVAKSGTRRR